MASEFKLVLWRRLQCLAAITFIFFCIATFGVKLFSSNASASAVSSSVRDALVVGDNRQAMLMLEKALPHGFSKIEYVPAQNGNPILVQASEFETLFDPFSFSIPIELNPLTGLIAGHLIFHTDLLNSFLIGVILWIVFVLLMIPFAIKSIAAAEERHQKDLRLHQAETAELLARQVAHDIRSPLSVLTLLSRSFGVEDAEKAKMLSSVAKRVSDIAEDLLSQSRAAEGVVRASSGIGEAERANGDGSGEMDRGLGSNLGKKKFGSRGADSADEETEMRESEKLDLLERVCLFELVNSVVEEKRLEVETDGARTVSLSGEVGSFAKVKASDFQRVVTNLINNSIEATDVAQGRVRVSVVKARAQLQLTIEDNGCGIAEDLIPKLGERGATYGKAAGNGLGLFHAKNAVEGWGGRMRIQSRLGVGTRVEITLPRTT